MAKTRKDDNPFNFALMLWCCWQAASRSIAALSEAGAMVGELTEASSKFLDVRLRKHVPWEYVLIPATFVMPAAAIDAGHCQWADRVGTWATALRTRHGHSSGYGR